MMPPPAQPMRRQFNYIKINGCLGDEACAIPPAQEVLVKFLDQSHLHNVTQPETTNFSDRPCLFDSTRWKALPENKDKVLEGKGAYNIMNFVMDSGIRTGTEERIMTAAREEDAAYRKQLDIVTITPDISKQTPRNQWSAQTKLACQSISQIAYLEDLKSVVATSNFDEPRECYPLVHRCLLNAFKAKVIQSYDMHDTLQALEGTLRLKDVELPDSILRRSVYDSNSTEGQPSSGEGQPLNPDGSPSSSMLGWTTTDFMNSMVGLPFQSDYLLPQKYRPQADKHDSFQDTLIVVGDSTVLFGKTTITSRQLFGSLYAHFSPYYSRIVFLPVGGGSSGNICSVLSGWMQYNVPAGPEYFRGLVIVVQSLNEEDTERAFFGKDSMAKKTTRHAQYRKDLEQWVQFLSKIQHCVIFAFGSGANWFPNEPKKQADFNKAAEYYTSQLLRTGHVVINPYMLYETMPRISRTDAWHFHNDIQIRTDFCEFLIHGVQTAMFYYNHRRLRYFTLYQQGYSGFEHSGRNRIEYMRTLTDQVVQPYTTTISAGKFRLYNEETQLLALRQNYQCTYVTVDAFDEMYPSSLAVEPEIFYNIRNRQLIAAAARSDALQEQSSLGIEDDEERFNEIAKRFKNFLHDDEKIKLGMFLRTLPEGSSEFPVPVLKEYTLPKGEGGLLIQRIPALQETGPIFELKSVSLEWPSGSGKFAPGLAARVPSFGQDLTVGDVQYSWVNLGRGTQKYCDIDRKTPPVSITSDFNFGQYVRSRVEKIETQIVLEKRKQSKIQELEDATARSKVAAGKAAKSTADGQPSSTSDGIPSLSDTTGSAVPGAYYDAPVTPHSEDEPMYPQEWGVPPTPETPIPETVADEVEAVGEGLKQLKIKEIGSLVASLVS